MVDSETSKNLSYIAMYEVRRAYTHPGEVAGSVPFSGTTVRFESSTQQYIVQHQRNFDTFRDKVAAVQALQKAWLKDLVEVESGNSSRFSQLRDYIIRTGRSAAQQL